MFTETKKKAEQSKTLVNFKFNYHGKVSEKRLDYRLENLSVQIILSGILDFSTPFRFYSYSKLQFAF